MGPGQEKVIGLIAGKGQFPLIFARAARNRGLKVVAVAHKDETDPALEELTDQTTWVRVGQLGALIKAFKSAGVTRAVMCGGLTKTRMFRDVRPDLTALKLLPRLRHLGDDALLRALAEFLKDQGVEIVASHHLLPELLARPGAYTRRRLTTAEREDARWGWKVAGALGKLDVGQCVVVKNKVVVAVEALEGTDATIRRAGELAGKGTVVVKRCKPGQDERFDMPAVGPETIKVMASAGAGALVVEAGRTLVFNREEMNRLAEKAGIAIEAWEGQGDGTSD